ncbi:hypothetical protein NK55_00115 [Thermosynechococcus sp. NK55a]|jgi:gas vesicle protein|uniref:hypothetical protein n=1 Tax=unclassified Thermosynechococcus TaxID=2622553 RepID=UPI0003D7D0FD|nr:MULTISPECIES: hypothetical protein [unclassified Thermosynechococcus]AHB87416.1 hypothetical protein NK55_00115 [Thermosynechococcus sp. NK55a]RMD79262.1 MAG: hypothetical protein D6823_04850 [Chloroflexota bacterium]HIK24188.1 hypothetical protein [Thermosynechococcus sp. M3746_W2019_013]
MENRGNGFGWGFLVGALFGGITGSLVTLLLKDRLAAASTDKSPRIKDQRSAPLQGNDEPLMEAMRLELEAKIAQINEAVDDLQNRLSHEDQP